MRPEDTNEETNETQVSAIQLNDVVKELLNASKQKVAENVVNILVETEIGKRTDMVIKGLNMRKEADAALKKVSKPDIQHFDESGQQIGAVFSKNAIEEKKKATERLGKIDKALNEALDENPNYGKLMELVK